MSEQHMDFAAMSAPGAEHGRLEAFAGKFRAAVKIWMGPGEPMVSSGTMTNTVQLGGRFLQQEYVGDPNPGPFPSFQGRGYWGFNKATGKYEGFWIDTASTCMQFETGDVDAAGRRWTMIGQVIGPDGQPIIKRSVITFVDANHHTLEMFFVTGGKESRAMEIHYQRA